MKIMIKQVLNRELKNRGETINSIAENCKIPVSTLHNWIQGTLPTAKNFHLIKAHSDYLNLSLSELLFNTKEERPEVDILFSSTFVDQERRYRLIIERLPK